MIIGNGVDLLEINRISELLERRPEFLERFFTKKEAALFESKNFKHETIAAGFAAKEAIAKAMGTGVRGFDLIDVEVLRDPLGKPVVVLHGRALEVARSKGIDRIELSLSHSKTQAIAFAIAIGENK